MKFEYKEDDRDTRECVAFIDEDGDLIFPDGYLSAEGWLSGNSNLWEDQKRVKKFYPGDKLTIVF